MEESNNNSKKGLIIGVIVAIAVATALTVCYALGLFTSPQKMIKKAVANRKDTFIEDYSISYNAASQVYGSMNGDMTASVDVTLGEQVKSLLNTYGSSYGLDLTWIDSAGAEIALDVQESLLGLNSTYYINGVDIVSLNAIIDAASEKAYLTVPKAMGDMALSENLDVESEEIVDILSSYLESLSTYSDRYPTPDKLDEIISKYTDAFATDLAKSEIVKTKSEISAGDITATYTGLAIDLDDKTLSTIVVDLVDIFENDDELKEIMRPIIEEQIDANVFPGYYDFDTYWNDLISDFDYNRQDALEKLDSIAEDADANEEIGVVYVYLDRKYNCVGIAFEDDEDDVKMEYYTPEKGDSKAILLKYTLEGTEEFVFEGQGETKKNLLNGTYSLDVEGQDLFTAQIVDFNKKEYEDGRNFNGQIVISLGTAASEYISDSTLQMLTLADYAFTFASDDTKREIELNVLVGDESLIDIKTSFVLTDVTDMSIPSKVYDLDNASDDEMMEFIRSLDLTSIINGLKEAGVPEDYYERLTALNDALILGDDTEIMYALADLMGEDVSDYDTDEFDIDDYDIEDYSQYEDELSMLAGFSYDEFASLYRLYYDSSASDDEIEYYYEMIQEYYGQ